MSKFIHSIPGAVVKIVLCTALVFFSTSAFAQEGTVQGMVTDEKTGEPMPFVNVTIKGTTTGDITDEQGGYSLSVPGAGSVIVFSFVGYETHEVEYDGQATLDIIMVEAFTEVEQVIVVGYGVVKKQDLTGAVSVVSSEAISKTNSSRLDHALQGKAAGVLVSSTTGHPGSNATVKIRGIGSINRESEPLYVIDGMPVSGGINHLNPGDIESVNILKDASATAIYGARGANGVVIITTKRGNAGPPSISFSAYTSYSKIPKLYDVMNADEYVSFLEEAYESYNTNPLNEGLEQPFPDAYSDSARAGHGWIDTDWQKEVSRPAWGQNYDLRISGGSETNNYMLSGNYFSDDGILIGTSMDRYTLKANSDYKLGKRIRIGESVHFSSIYLDEQSHYTNGNPWLVSAITSPLMPVYDENNKGGYAGPTPEVTPVNERTNPVAEQMLNDNTGQYTRFLVSLYAEIDIWKGFRFRTNFGYDGSFSKTRRWNPVYELGTIGGRSRSISVLNESRGDGYRYVWDKQLIYENSFGSHNLNVTFVHSNEEGGGSSIQAKGENFDFENLNVMGMADPETYTAGGGFGTETMESYLGRINYNYKSKYYLTASVRNDGSSKFGPKNKRGTFPSFSLAWRFNEDLLRQFDFISMAKLRFGYGVTGNENIGGFQYESYIDQAIHFVTAMGDPARSVFGRGPLYNFGNSAIQWEEARMTNAGLDFAFFNNRLEFTAEYYYKNQYKMLAQMPVSVVHGRLEFFEPWVNLSDMINRGLEFTAIYKKLEGDFQYTVNANLSTIKNEVKNLPADRDITKSHSITTEGHSISSFYGHVAEGIFQSWEEIETHAFQNKGTSPGDIKFKDLNKDAVINDRDRTIIGKPLPDLTYGLSFDCSYMNFDFQVFFYGMQNLQIYNNFRAGAGLATDGDSKDNNKLTDVLDHWSSTNLTNEQVRANFNDPNDNNRISSFFVEDASFMRIKNMQLGYTLPDKALNVMRMKNLRIYISGTNLLTFTKYEGYDPEIGSRDNLNFGIDYGTYPVPRTFVVGLQLTL